ncbi:MAG: copper oxidase [Bacteroidetes bacterium]|nr:MAG: copper oxidase [Bacteroidota bacterium]
MKNKIQNLLVLILTICPTVANSQNILPIPDLDTGTWIGGGRTYNLLMANDSTEFFQSIKTPTSGYNGSYLGPTLRMHQGDSVVLNVTNQLGENSTTHWHGFHVPANMDGGPHQMIPDNSSWTATFKMLNLASTFWYHPHHKPTFWSDPNGTGGQVHRGLAGMIIVEDSVTDNLNLPKTYGTDDIPLIIQDRAFNSDGTFKEFLNLPTLVVRTGDTMLVNGAITPTLSTHSQMIRFRILNASNGRSYYLGFNDNRNFYQIGSDGGLLESPITLNRLRISPAERAEIVVDFSNDLNSTIHLLSYASELIDVFPTYPPLLLDEMDTTNYRIMSFDIGSASSNPIFSIPSVLTTVPLYVETDAVNYMSPRIFAIANGSPLATINGVSMDLNVINETIQLGDLEVWEISNTSGVAHPFHIHGAPFQILSRSNGPVPPNEQGWKDVVLIPAARNQANPGRVKIIKPFLDFADSTNPYMYHCHILEHEDRGMMGQYVVVDTNEVAGINELIAPIKNTKLFPNPVFNTDQIVKIEFSTTISDKYTLVLLDQSGQIIRSYFENKSIKFGIQQFELNTKNIPAGTYYLSISSSQAKSVQKLIKLK